MTEEQVRRLDEGTRVVLAAFHEDGVDEPKQTGELLSNRPENGTVGVQVEPDEDDEDDDGLREVPVEQVIGPLRELVWEALDNASANGHDFVRGRARQIAEDLMAYDANLEDCGADELVGDIRAWQQDRREGREP